MPLLLLEDDDVDRIAVERALKRSDFVVDHAATVEQALSRVRQRRYDCALVDYNLPDGTGLDFARAALKVHPTLPLVMLTGAVGHDYAQDALEAGAQDYLAKDGMNPSMLSRALRYAIGRMRANEERAELQDQLQRARSVEGLAMLAGGVAHDFNNLLVAIRGNADVLAQEQLTDSSRQALRDISSATEQAAELCRQMLAYAGQDTYEPNAIDLGDLATSTVRLLTPRIPRGLSLDVEAHPVIARGDAAQLRRALVNLLINTIDARATRVRVSVGMRRVETELEQPPFDILPPGLYASLEIQDDGEGIDLAHLDRVFAPFFSTRMSGRGLGLAAVAGVLRAHRGMALVESTIGVGTNVTLLLRRGQTSSEDILLEESLPSHQGARVLVVDDETLVLRAIRRMLSRTTFDLILVDSGEEALRHIGDVDMALIDLTMPGMSGGELVRLLHEEHPQLPVVLMSGFSEEKARGEVPPVSGFVAKPFTQKDLTRALIRALARAEA